MTSSTLTVPGTALANRICSRAHAQMVRMIFEANHRDGARPGDPKVGGHPASCASSLHILGALHLAVRRPEDYLACKPHAAPMDHAFSHLLDLFGREDGSWLSEEESKALMGRLRAFPQPGAEEVFQSYHARSDPDSFHFLPSGSVGIPPVASVYLALAHRYMEDHGKDVPRGAHFWSLIGDSEFREGSLLEAMPDAAERLLGNVTWIIDYNRQNLDGTRIPNEKGLHSRDCDRIAGTAQANGWHVIQVRHGALRRRLFERPGGDAFRELLENVLSDYEFQLLLYKSDALLARTLIRQHSQEVDAFCSSLSDDELMGALADLGGHDLAALVEALELARTDPAKPCLVIAHTVKGFGLRCAADPANHSSLPSREEVEALLVANGLSAADPFARFPSDSEEGRFLQARSAEFRSSIERSRRVRREKRDAARKAVEEAGGLPESFEIDTSLFPTAHTQWMWGQIAAKLVRISTANDGGPSMGGGDKELTENERRWASVADYVLTLSPDVGTSTNIAPVLDRRVYGPESDAPPEDTEFDARHPELMTRTDPWTRHIRFEIAEANCMSAAGAFGKMAHYTGNPSFPVMTVYDFFIKRALDQLYYNLYWGAEFVLLGTPSGVTLSSEGAQHSWKSDIQIPNLITWEPLFVAEMEWILADAIRRHMLDENEGRRGVLIRGVTRAIRQSLLLENLRRQARHKVDLAPGSLLTPAGSAQEGAIDESTVPARPDEEILAKVRLDCLEGGYFLVDYRGYAGYEPGDNVVHIVSMGSPTTEALAASEALLERGIFANVLVVTSPELLVGILGEASDYAHLTRTLGVNGDLHGLPARVAGEAESISLAGRRVPIVAVCDGEAGLLDNVGAVVGVKQRTLAVRRFSKCGRPDEVYRYQGLDRDSIVEAAGRVLAETALENVRISPAALERLARSQAAPVQDWRELWPSR
ncbi:MAG TPA: pyruvate dehydrogenase [Planctomycetes bacterium]|nr:pyruvate dehydrogenase [Planctomycetota bacterium]